VPIPKPIPAETTDETFAGVTYHISGELVPQLRIELQDADVFFEHHTLLWKDVDLKIQVKKLSGAIKRKFAGGEFFVSQAAAPGNVAFSRDAPGHVLALHIDEGDELNVREHQFLAATSNMEYSFERVKGVRNMFFGGTGFFMDKFKAKKREGIVWVHGNGNVLLVELAAGEQIDVEPGGWLFKDRSVKMEAHTTGLKTGIFGGGGKLTWNRFSGPGRVGIQTMYIDPLGASGEDDD
jgi:uncharacterized protein (AIM24 family)